MANGRCPLATQRGSARAAGSGDETEALALNTLV